LSEEEEDKCCDMNVMKTVLRCSPSDAKVSAPSVNFCQNLRVCLNFSAGILVSLESLSNDTVYFELEMANGTYRISYSKLRFH